MVVATNLIPHVWPYTLSLAPGAPTADIRVRKALNLAIDRAGLVKLLDGFAVASVAQVPPAHPWFGNPSFKIGYDRQPRSSSSPTRATGPATISNSSSRSRPAARARCTPLIMTRRSSRTSPRSMSISRSRCSSGTRCSRATGRARRRRKNRGFGATKQQL
ncbi:MAG: hypothetical protein WDO24_30300 [Pseudomonadota bacterium]